ncbi:hypothetical protein HD806DRAFT_231010 [Xylariaceae sp. AK1471]|nr:hypothetical protein HD806DRAFT_231010 [Xylariaceae sp. AK1471]
MSSRIARIAGGVASGVGAGVILLFGQSWNDRQSQRRAQELQQAHYQAEAPHREICRQTIRMMEEQRHRRELKDRAREQESLMHHTLPLDPRVLIGIIVGIGGVSIGLMKAWLIWRNK